MSLDRTATAAEPQVGVSPPDRDLSAPLAERRRARADAAATRRLPERLRSQPSMQDFRNDLEDALVNVAAQVVQAMIRLREQRQEGVVDVGAVTDNVTAAVEALAAAELTAVVMRSVVPAPRA
ncbi:hypothetical protein [Pseudonocardia sp. ICBG1142]|uniref:hypothetical protein n=1 Tax=Pseudonocardia sp. ICBG1142 TaxID=2846760 RepID=UPI001CF6E527|nr:hypothetical protein [Pseudonocardia sp. ICBG1142]